MQVVEQGAEAPLADAGEHARDQPDPPVGQLGGQRAQVAGPGADVGVGDQQQLVAGVAGERGQVGHLRVVAERRGAADDGDGDPGEVPAQALGHGEGRDRAGPRRPGPARNPGSPARASEARFS